ncbi:ArsR family transcriptional regulator [Methanoregula sp.]|uniref:flavodoxin family protein n=1 Tax=Methanoregula sp. TaxID=2052170 RepID=UPI00236AB75C|nr:ArsR family transcriptional regulator [Methanoregula sp.]MDD1685891.1 ArsR family transcriptional regulator [Methanoregula sp.]
MKTSIVVASYSGTTRGIAEQIQKTCGGEIIDVKSRDLLSRFVTFMARHSPGMNVTDGGTVPERIDVTGSSLVVIGTPVWGGKPVPAIRKAIAGLHGCEGKPVVIFATCGEKPGSTLEVLVKDLAAKGMTVAGQFSLNKKAIDDGTQVTALIAKIQETGNSP